MELLDQDVVRPVRIKYLAIAKAIIYFRWINCLRIDCDWLQKKKNHSLAFDCVVEWPRANVRIENIYFLYFRRILSLSIAPTWVEQVVTWSERDEHNNIDAAIRILLFPACFRWLRFIIVGTATLRAPYVACFVDWRVCECVHASGNDGFQRRLNWLHSLEQTYHRHGRIGARYVTNIMHKFAVDIILPSALFIFHFFVCVVFTNPNSSNKV